MTTYALYADSAVFAARGCHREIERSTDRAKLEAEARRRREEDDAAGRYTTVYWVDPVAA